MKTKRRVNRNTRYNSDNKSGKNILVTKVSDKGDKGKDGKATDQKGVIYVMQPETPVKNRKSLQE